MLNPGKKAIMGPGITNRGEISIKGNIRHWIVLEQIIRMGSGGWVRIYDPFFNQEAVYPYNNIFDTGVSSNLGLWVDMK